MLLTRLLSMSVAAVISVSNWGLSFNNGKNNPPTGDVPQEILAKYSAAFIGDTAKKTVYITFDAGFENGQTAQILDTLKEAKVPAAFFLVENYLKQEPDMVKRMAAEGHIVGNHTMKHPDMSALGEEEFSREIKGMEDAYKTVVGAEMPKFYRPPMGKFNENNLKWAQKLGYKTVFWSLAYVDWHRDKQPTREQAMNKLLSRVHNGAIILLHSTSQTNADILGDFIKEMRKQGYEFGSLAEL